MPLFLKYNTLQIGLIELECTKYIDNYLAAKTMIISVYLSINVVLQTYVF